MHASEDVVVLEKGVGRIDEHGLLLEYALKFLFLAAFFELVLYRLVSRLGMHLSKLAAQYDWIRVLFKALSSIGFTLLNVVSLLAFLCLSLIILMKLRELGRRISDRLIVGAVALLLVLTVAFLILPPVMLGAIIYNIVTWIVLGLLGVEYLKTHRHVGQRAMVVTFLLGVSGWLYYQTISTVYGFWEILAVPPWAHEINRLGEAMMVLSSVLAFWAYGGISVRTSNRRQRKRVLWTIGSGVAVFLALFFLDYVLVRYDPATAESVRKAGEGIGWIFQMGMGYTFYLPFACYVAGLFCWSYAVLKQVTMGRLAGYGLGLMFMAGYALQLSHLTLMVVLGLLLLTMERQRVAMKAAEPLEGRPEGAAMVGAAGTMVGERI
ncbi:hypothetical protein [Candidatus Nitrospira bockiana]